jgi:hypothetical protein
MQIAVARALRPPVWSQSTCESLNGGEVPRYVQMMHKGRNTLDVYDSVLKR